MVCLWEADKEVACFLVYSFKIFGHEIAIRHANLSRTSENIISSSIQAIRYKQASTSKAVAVLSYLFRIQAISFVKYLPFLDVVQP